MTIIAVSGKGGVGKTLVSALLVKCLAEEKKGSILAIDADPDANFGNALGVSAEKSIGDLREEMLEKTLPLGVEKKSYLDAKVFEIVVETDRFDFIQMGRPEGPGCYCAVNHMLREILDNVSESYDYVVIDCEAGLEHISRRTTKKANVVLLVTDQSKNGLITAMRIKELSTSLGIKFNNIFLVLNRISESGKKIPDALIKETGITQICSIPEDEIVAEYNLLGKPMIELPEDSKAYKSVKQLVSLMAGQWT